MKQKIILWIKKDVPWHIRWLLSNVGTSVGLLLFSFKYHQVGYILLLFLGPCKLWILKIRFWVGYKKRIIAENDYGIRVGFQITDWKPLGIIIIIIIIIIKI